jgi:hypothetical protein
MRTSLGMTFPEEKTKRKGHWERQKRKGHWERRSRSGNGKPWTELPFLEGSNIVLR